MHSFTRLSVQHILTCLSLCIIKYSENKWHKNQLITVNWKYAKNAEHFKFNVHMCQQIPEI